MAPHIRTLLLRRILRRAASFEESTLIVAPEPSQVTPSPLPWSRGPPVTDPMPAAIEEPPPPTVSSLNKGSARPPRTQTWRRWAMRFAVALTVLGVLCGLDRVAESITAGKLAERVQSTQHLTARPEVTIAGFPFLLQVLKGRYHDVTITAKAPIDANGVAVNNATAHLHGVKVALSDAIHGTVSDLPVQSGTGSALITYPQLDTIVHRYGGTVGQQITVHGLSSGHARLQGPFGMSLTVTAAITNGKLVVTPDPTQLNALPGLVKALLTDALATPIPLPTFPFNVHLESVQLDTAGVHLIASSTNSVFPIR